MRKSISLITALVLLLALCSCANTAAEKAESTAEAPESVSALPSGKVFIDTPDFYLELLDCREEPVNNEYVLEFLAENRCSKAVEFGSEYAAVNGYVMDSYMYNVMAPGRRSISYLEILSEDINLLDAGSVDEVSFLFYANTTEEGCVTGTVFRDVINVYPGGKSPDEISTKKLSDFPYSEFAYGNSWVDLIVVDAKMIENSPFYAVTCVISNKSGEDLTLSLSDAEVDSVKTEPYWLCRIPAGTNCISDIFFDSDALSETGWLEPDLIAFNLEVYRGLTYDPQGNPASSCRLSFTPARG